tara:strand:+ start:57 stop:251 length:195 start_codon:yes stop_codon:yes gene_type:complete
MATKFDLLKLEKKYKKFSEKAYNLQSINPAESDYYAHKANKIRLKLMLLNVFTHNRLAKKSVAA